MYLREIKHYYYYHGRLATLLEGAGYALNYSKHSEIKKFKYKKMLGWVVGNVA